MHIPEHWEHDPNVFHVNNGTYEVSVEPMVQLALHAEQKVVFDLPVFPNAVFSSQNMDDPDGWPSHIPLEIWI